MQELEKTARELILDITEKTLKTLHDKGLLKEPSKILMLCSSPEMTSLIKKLSTPKYDPCRLFRKGDKVRLVPFNGRAPIMYGSNVFGIEEVLTVAEDENKEYEVLVNGTSARQIFPACFLELVTPVEEMVPYSVRHNEAHAAWSIYGPFGLSAVNYFYGERYPYTQEQAKAAAEAERDRLNADYRSAKNDTAPNS